jgi:hypothetical protein
VVAVASGAGVDVASGALVGVEDSDVGATVGVLAASVSVGALVAEVTVEGSTVSVAGGAETVFVGFSSSSGVALKFDAADVSAILGAAAVVAHPRRSMSKRIAARIRLTTSLKRS